MKTRKVDLQNLQTNVPETVDIFICSSSFEDRCLSVGQNIDAEGVRNAVIASALESNIHTEYNRRTLEDLFGANTVTVDVSISDPLSTADNLDKCIESVKERGSVDRILLDITTFTHESLLILLRLLQLRCPNADILGAYANAAEYSIGDSVGHKWLSRGVREVRSVLGFPGTVIPSQRTHLIIIVGYEHERAAGIIESIDPHSIALGYGRSGSATTEKDKEANEHFVRLVEQVASSYSSVNKFEIPCDNPYGTYVEICSQIEKVEREGVNIVIAPMNNKLSTVGTAWAAFEREEVQLCYAEALRYNYTNYSALGSQCYVFDLSLSQNGQSIYEN